MAYSLKILEEELKNSVSKDFFSNYDSKILGRVDFCILMWGTKNGPLGLVEKGLSSSTF